MWLVTKKSQAISPHPPTIDYRWRYTVTILANGMHVEGGWVFTDESPARAFAAKLNRSAGWPGEGEKDA